MSAVCPTCFGAGCKRCWSASSRPAAVAPRAVPDPAPAAPEPPQSRPESLPPPFTTAARWRTLLDVCRQFDDRTNHGAAPIEREDS